MKNILITIVITGAIVAAMPSDAQELPNAPGKATVVKLCSECHNVSQVIRVRGTMAEWRKIVDRMVDAGADGTDAELEAVISYMSGNFGKPLWINTASSSQIRDSLGLSSDEANAIVKYRLEHGRFAKWEDVVRVPGIDKASIEAQKLNLVFDAVRSNGIATVTALGGLPDRR